MKKRLILIVPIILLCLIFFTKQTDAGYPILNLTSNAKTISAGQKTQLKVGGVKASKIKWTSSNKNVATVSKKGVVTGVSTGKATIKGKYRGVEFKVKFTVTPSNKTNAKLLCKDKNLSVYLEKIENGKIYLKFKNTSSIDFKISCDYFVLGEDVYYNDNVYNELYSGLSRSFKLELYDENYNDVDYHFYSGKLSAQFDYYDYSDDDSDNWLEEEIKFTTTIK